MDRILHERLSSAEATLKAHKRDAKRTVRPRDSTGEDPVHARLDRAFRVACIEYTMWYDLRKQLTVLPPDAPPLEAKDLLSMYPVCDEFLDDVFTKSHLFLRPERPGRAAEKGMDIAATANVRLCWIRWDISLTRYWVPG